MLEVVKCLVRLSNGIWEIQIHLEENQDFFGFVLSEHNINIRWLRFLLKYKPSTGIEDEELLFIQF